MEEDRQSRSWARVFLIISGFLIVFLFLLLWQLRQGSQPRDGWLKEADRHLRTETRENALVPIIEAFHQTEWEALSEHRPRLAAIASRGWSEATPETGELIERHRVPISLITRSASFDSLSFPPTSSRGLEMPRPDIGEVHEFTLLLVANAQRALALGRTEDGIERLLEALRFGQRFCRPRDQSSLPQHVAGLSSMEISLQTLRRALQQNTFSEEMLQKVQTQIAAIEQDYVSITEALRAEAEIFRREMTERFESTQRLAQGLQFYDEDLAPRGAMNLAKALQADTLTFSQEHDRVWSELESIFSQPIFEQPVIDAKWFQTATENRLVWREYSSISPLLIREAVLLAQLRLVQLLCERPLTPDQIQHSGLTDPFSGEPFQLSADRLFSIGPDQATQQGTMIYDPQEGITSQGDIVVFPREEALSPQREEEGPPA